MEIDVGSVVGDYQVTGILGAGGMGKVYKVRSTISDRQEAMKVLLPDLAREPELADRFVREIKVQASLDHPNIASLRTALKFENQLLMIIELVEGVTLEQRLRQGPLSVSEAVNYTAQVLSALSYAHKAGVVHRDIKPANMMLTANGVIKLMDFGIAKAAADRRLTMTGTTMGSLYYMSPEQIKGEQTLDARADLYSLGVTLYELVTGKRPFDGDSQFAIMSAHLEKVPVPPITLDPRLPAALNDVIMMAVQKDRNARFQTADAFRNALVSVTGAPVSKGAPVMAPASAAAVSGGVGNSRRGLWIGVGAVCAVAALIAVIQFGPRRNAAADSPASQPAASAPQPAVSAPPSRQDAATPVEAAPPPETRSTGTAAGQGSPPPQPAASPAQRNTRVPGSTTARVPQTAPQEKQQVTPAPAVQTPPVQTPPVQQPVQQASPQTAPGPDLAAKRAEAMKIRESFAKLSARASSVRGTLQNLQRSQAASGLGMSSNLSTPWNLMESFLKGAEDAITANDVAAAQDLMDKADRQIDRLETLLNK